MRRTIVLVTAMVAGSVGGFLVLLMAYVVLGASTASAASTTYDIQILSNSPTSGESGTYANDIDDSGNVVGVSGNSIVGEQRAFLCTASCTQQSETSDSIKILGTLGGNFSEANDIGAAFFGEEKKIVGSSTTSAGERHAFVCNLPCPNPDGTGGMKDLGTLGGGWSVAHDINNSGQIVGGSDTSSLHLHAFLCLLNCTLPDSEGGSAIMQDLGTLGGESVAEGINASGQVVGWSRSSTNNMHAFLYSANHMNDLGTLTGGTSSSSAARDINDSGQVVGESTSDTGFNHAFLSAPGGGQMQDLGTLGGSGSFAHGVNDSGQVVGGSFTSSRAFHAFLTAPGGGQMQDLNTLIPASSDIELIQANAINNSGQIVGFAVINGDTSAAFLATPQPVDSASSEVAAGGTLSTATGDGTASSTDPVNTTITSPVGGTVSITETSTTQQAPSGFTFFGKQVNLEAPEATVENPLILKFVLDASLLPMGQDPNTLELFRNGTLAGECADASATASPDPCVSKREALISGDVAITVLTSHASAWNFAAPSYEFAGLYSPVDNLPTLNKAKAGSAIPVKFSLGGDMGLNVFAKDQGGSYPKSGSIVCDSGATADTIEQTVNAGSSSLSYDASTGRYTYVWKTDKKWQTSCRQLVLEFKDGTEHRANFQFTK